MSSRRLAALALGASIAWIPALHVRGETAVTFEAEQALRVFVVQAADEADDLAYAERDCLAGGAHLVGTTPAEVPLEVPAGVTWFVAPVDTGVARPTLDAVLRDVAEHRVPGLSFRGCVAVGDVEMTRVAALRDLAYLDLRGTSVSARGLAALGGHPSLRWLDAADRQPADLSWIARLPELRSLDISGAWLPSGALEGPGRAQRLESLTVRRASEFGAGVLTSLRRCKTLKHLFAGENNDLRDAELTHLAALLALEHLELARTGVTDAGLAALARCRRLESLDLSECSVDGSGLAELAGARNLRRIVLRKTRAGDAAAATLAGLAGLRSVSLADTAVGDEGVAALARHGSLEELDLTDCAAVTERALPALETMTSLRRLDIRGTSVPRSAVRALARALPRCDVR